MFNIGAIYLFSKMIEDIIDVESAVKLDMWINTHIVLLWNPMLNTVMIWITTLANPWSLLILSIAL